MSFRDEFTAHDRSFFLNSVLPVPIISPLWFNYDLSTTGSIYYKVTEEPSLLEEVRAMIVNRNLELNDYYPKLAIIVTWFDISLRGGFFEDSPLVRNYYILMLGYYICMIVSETKLVFMKRVSCTLLRERF